MRTLLCLAALGGCSQPAMDLPPDAAMLQEPAPPPAVLTMLTPPAAFAGRTVLLQLAGSGTHFGAATTVRFSDPALRTLSVAAASPGNLQVQVEVGEQAVLGMQDLTVSTPGAAPQGKDEEAALKGAFRVRAALALEPTGNTRTAPQGGVVDFNLRNQDLENPLGTGALPVAGVRPLLVTVLNNRISGYGIADALAQMGLVVQSESQGQRLRYTLDPIDTPQLGARPPVALTLGEARTSEGFAARQSNLYRLGTSTDGQVLTLTVSPGATLAQRTVAGALAPQSGRFSEGQFLYASANGTTQTLLGLLPKKGDHYLALVPSNLGGGTGYDYSLTARAAAARAFSTREDKLKPDGPAAPLASVTLDGPYYSTDGAFDGPTDADYVRVTVPRAGRLYVQVVTPSMHFGRASAAVALLQQDCMAPLAPLRTAQQEAAVTAMATYCVQLSGLGATEAYQLVLAQEL